MKTAIVFTNGATFSYKASQEIYTHLVGMGVIKPNPAFKFTKDNYTWEQKDLSLSGDGEKQYLKEDRDFSIARASYIIAKLNQLIAPEKLRISFDFPTLESTRFIIKTDTLPNKASVTAIEPSEGFTSTSVDRENWAAQRGFSVQ